MRATILRCVSVTVREDVDRDDNARLERLRKHIDDNTRFYNIDRKCQIQILIITIPA